MGWTDIYLRTSTEADLRAACPWLVEGEGGWIRSASDWFLDVIGPIVTVPAVLDAKGKVKTPAVIDDRFHANLRCTAEIAERVPEIITTNPATPGRVFAGNPPTVPVPEKVTMRQAKLTLSRTKPKSLLPEANKAISAMTGQAGEEARIEWEYATELRRDHPLIAGIGAALGLTGSQIDDLFRQAATIA